MPARVPEAESKIEADARAGILRRARPVLAGLFWFALPLGCGGSGDGGGGEGAAASGRASVGCTGGAGGVGSGCINGGGGASEGGTPGAHGGGDASSGGASSGGASSGGASSGGDSGSGGTAPNGGSGGAAAGSGAAGRSGQGGASNGGASNGGANGGAGTARGGAAAGGAATAGSAGNAGSASAGAPNGALVFEPSEGVYSYPRTAMTGPSQTFRLRNSGGAEASVDVALAGATPGAFRVASPIGLTKLKIAAGASLELGVELVPNGSGVPVAPTADNGGVAVSAELTATGAGSASLGLYGLIMTVAGMGSGGEATLGQALKTLGYAVDIGAALRDHLENTTTTTAQGSELKLPRFVRAGAGTVMLRPVARFSPSGAMPYGYYTVAAPNCATAASNAANCHVVGTMTTSADTNTSNGSRMLNPPLDAAGTSGMFDPGAEPFGIWAYTDQASQKVSTGGTAANGDYCYTDDALNVPSSMHRARVWPLKDRAGGAVVNAYLIGFEEASNGDYQDYVFVLTNVKAP